MTERLYYTDSGQLEFEAEITATGTCEGDHYTILNRSAFYPTSGGQLHDTGRLDDIVIIDVTESEAGEILHISREPVGEVGRSVTGQVDKMRRRRHCQAHTAQHILSAAFIELFGTETVSVHLGEEYAAVELETDSVSEEQLRVVEKFAANAVADNTPVEIFSVESDRAASLPLRKMPQRTGTVRVIRIGRLDCSACGGTHCTSTAEVGFIKILGSEKTRSGTLVKFLAGELAADDYLRRYVVTDQLTKQLTCHVRDLPAKVEKMSTENKRMRKELVEAHKRLLPVRARDLAGTALSHGDLMYVIQAEEIEPDIAGSLAGEVADMIEGLAVLLVKDRLVVAVSEKTGLHAGNLARRLSARTDLKGGGSNRLAQLGRAQAERLEYYREQLLSLMLNG